MKRHQQILLAVLIVQLILSVVTFWPKQASTEAGKAIFPNLKADDIVTLTITNDQQQTITLSKEDGQWGLAGADNYPTKDEAVTTVLEKLTKLTRGNLVAKTNTSHNQLQVDGENYMRRIQIELENGDSHLIYLGSAPRYTATHFRVAGEMETYLTTQLSTWELNVTPSSWIDTLYHEVDPSTLTEVVLENVNGTFTLIKEEDEWTLADLAAGEILAPGKVSDVVNKAARITLLNPLGTTAESRYGLDAPLARVTLKTADATYTVSIGAQNPTDSSYFVKASTSDYYAAVAQYGLKPLIENARADFMQEVETTESTTP